MRTTNISLYLLIIFILALASTSCLKEDEPVVEIPENDGIYIKGKVTAFNQFDRNGMMQPAIDLTSGIKGDGLYEIFLAVESGADGFNIIEVSNQQQRILGPVTASVPDSDGNNNDKTGWLMTGVFDEDAGVFTVPEDGVYHLIIDQRNDTYIILHVSDISLYGNSSESLWTDTEIPLSGIFDVSNIVFENNGLALGVGEFRFRYGKRDQIGFSGSDVVVSTSFGGEISGQDPHLELTMVQGGNNYILSEPGIYSVKVIWTVGQGFEAHLIGDGDAGYFANVFIIGDGVSTQAGESAWDWELNDFEMVPVHSRPHIFWSIVWLNGEGEIRFSPQKAWGDDFGKTGEMDNGLFHVGEDNVPVPSSSGFYMVAVNTRTEQISITQPQVYLIGDATGSWDHLNPDFRFTIDNSFEEISLLKRLNQGSLRMYAWHEEWFSNWWNAEFNINDGEIVFRGNGSNLEPTIVISGFFTIKLKFRTGEGLIELCGCS
jgi:hypothetical protein